MDSSLANKEKTRVRANDALRFLDEIWPCVGASKHFGRLPSHVYRIKSKCNAEFFFVVFHAVVLVEFHPLNAMRVQCKTNKLQRSKSRWDGSNVGDRSTVNPVKAKIVTSM